MPFNPSIQMSGDHFNCGIFVCQYIKRLIGMEPDLGFMVADLTGDREEQFNELNRLRMSMSHEMRVHYEQL